MKNRLVWTIAATVTATAATLALPAQARERWPAIPVEIGVAPRMDRFDWIAYRCASGPVYNFYHGAYYGEPPAVYLGYAYRPYYRYAAYRVLPRTYVCATQRYR